MGALILRLTKGANYLDLNDQTNYKVAPGFVPPAVQLSPVLSGGGSANRYNGSVLVDEKANTRQFSFQVHVIGTSENDVSAKAEGLSSFLAMAGDEDEPLYLEYRPSSAIAAEPIWGNAGANRRYKIIAAQGVTGGQFSGPETLRGKALKAVGISVTLAPYALGKPQRLIAAAGGIIEDVLGTVDGRARGTIAPEATTNLFSNPVFGNASCLTAWTVGADLVTAQITDPTRTYPGCANAVRVLSTATDYGITQSITLPATSHTISFYVRALDSGTVSSSDCDILYNSVNRISTYTNMGNGIWRVHFTVTGTAGAADTGLAVLVGRNIEVLGGQCEAKAYPTPLACGDFLGCAWSGTAHAAASTSARTAGKLRLAINEAENWTKGAGCIRVIMRHSVANTHPNNQYIFDARDATYTTSLHAYYTAADDKMNFAFDGLTTSTAAQTIAVNEVTVWHFAWGPTGRVIYKNGASAAAGGFGAVNTSNVMFIGSDYSSTAGAQLLSTIMDFAIYGREVTAAEVLADYANLYPVANGGRRVGAIPWRWTKDGDGIVDNAIDLASSTGAPHDNFIVMGAIPGSAPAATVFRVDPSASVTTVYMANWAIPYFMPPLNTLYFEQAGTAGAVTDSTANYLTSAAVSTTEVAIGTSGTAWADRQRLRLLYGREFYLAARMRDVSGANLTLAFRFYNNSTVSGAESTVTDFEVPKTISTSYFGLSLTPSLVLPPLKSVFPLTTVGPEATTVVLAGKRTTGSADIYVDYICLMPYPLFSFSCGASNNVIQGRAVTVLTSTNTAAFTRQITGDPIDLEPDLFNVILVAMHNSAANTTVQETLDFNFVQITPRYSLF